MAHKQRSIILDSCGDEHGDLLRIGRNGSRYFIDRIGEAYTPKAGETKRIFMSKEKAEKAFASGSAYLGHY